MLWTKQGWCSGAEDKPKPFLVHSLFTAAAQSNPSNGNRSSVVTVTSQRKAGMTQLEDVHKYWLLPSTNSFSLSTMWYTVSLFAPSRLFLISKQHRCSKCTIQIDNIIQLVLPQSLTGLRLVSNSVIWLPLFFFFLFAGGFHALWKCISCLCSKQSHLAAVGCLKDFSCPSTPPQRRPDLFQRSPPVIAAISHLSHSQGNLCLRHPCVERAGSWVPTPLCIETTVSEGTMQPVSPPPQSTHKTHRLVLRKVWM